MTSTRGQAAVTFRNGNSEPVAHQPPTLLPRPRHPPLCLLYEFDYSRHLLSAASHSVLPFGPGFLQRVRRQGSVTLACVRTAFLFKAESCSLTRPRHVLSIHSSVDRHCGWLYLSAAVNDAARNTCVPTCIPGPAFQSLGWTPRSGTAGTDRNLF